MRCVPRGALLNLPLWSLLLQVVRAPVALAMVKLLKLLPEEAMIQQLPQALQGVAHLLRNRLQRIRCLC